MDTFKEMSSLNMAHHGQISCVFSDGGSGNGSAVNKTNSSAFRHCVITGGMDGTCRVCMYVCMYTIICVCMYARTYVCAVVIRCMRLQDLYIPHSLSNFTFNIKYDMYIRIYVCM